MGTWGEGREALSLPVLGGAEWWHTRAWLLAHQLSFSAASPDHACGQQCQCYVPLVPTSLC